MKKKILILLAIILVIGIVWGVYFWQNNKPVPENNEATTTLPGWQSYSSTYFGFKVKYPPNWIYVENKEKNTVYYGHKVSPGGYQWRIGVTTVDKLEEAIAHVGDQFSDRQETRENITINGIKGIIVTVTTQEFDNLTSKSIYLTKDNKLFIISNGAVEDEDFPYFYNSFDFINLKYD